MELEKTFRSGFVTLIGRPNVGKSTLLNQISGTRLAITSHKPQTTRHVIRAIHDDADSQIIFMDTPGMHQPKNKLGEYMINSARQALADTDVMVLLIEAGFDPRVGDMEKRLLGMAEQVGKPVVLVINKVDMVAKEKLLPLLSVFAGAYPFAAMIPVSARTGDGVDVLLQEIRKLLPEGPRYFPEDSLTDQTERMLVGEMIREQVLKLIHEEIPHGTAVVIESFKESFGQDRPEQSKQHAGNPEGMTAAETATNGLPNGSAAGLPADSEQERTFVHIEAAILCERDTHKAILIGKQGQMLKQIGSRSRKEIEAMLGCPCYLKLFVKVREDWRNRKSILNDLGYDSRRD